MLNMNNVLRRSWATWSVNLLSIFVSASVYDSCQCLRMTGVSVYA
jgi:hypothetical protein